MTMGRCYCRILSQIKDIRLASLAAMATFAETKMFHTEGTRLVSLKRRIEKAIQFGVYVIFKNTTKALG